MRSKDRRNTKATGILIATAALLIAGAGCSSKDDDGATSSGSDKTTTTADAAKALGKPNKATGTPITVGYVTDGKTEAIDATPQTEAAKAGVEYINNYLGGINGHPLELSICEAKANPSATTTCGVQMVKDKVAAVLTPAVANDAALFKSLQGSGIPYFTYTTAANDILLQPGAYVLSNPLGIIGASALVAKDADVKKSATVIIDVPAATGPVTAIAKPMYAKANVELEIVPISPSVADQTPQIQQAISSGAGAFSVTGDETFNTKAIKSLKQIGFKGPIVLGVTLTEESIKSIPGGVEGVTLLTSNTLDPEDKDVQTFNAVMDKYAPDVTTDAYTPFGYITVVGLQHALEGATDATDAASINKALSSMPKAVEKPMGAGSTFQCGADLVSITPNVCTTAVLQATLDAEGTPGDYKLLDTAPLMP